MKPEELPIVMDDFIVNSLAFNYIPYDDEVEIDEEITDVDTLDVDFDILPVNEDYNEILIDLTVSMNFNQKNLLPGYSMIISAEGSFSHVDETVEQQERILYLTSIGLGMMFSQVRSYIYQISGYYPDGPLMLPVFDNMKLLQSKYEELLKSVEKTTKKKKAKKTK